MSVYIEQNGSEVSFDNPDSWVILSPIEQSIKAKIEAAGTPLKDWDISIYRGILTGYNDAFIISGEKKDELIAADPKSAEIIRPILRGRDIKRYGYDNNNLFLLYIPWHFPLHNDTSIKGASVEAEILFKEQYPAVYNHLLQYKDELSSRNKAETGIRYEWYALQRWGAKYTDDFSKQKIIYPNMTKFLPFLYDDEGFITNQKCFIITGENIAYLTAFLNSSVFKLCFKDDFPELLGGTRELSKIFFEKIPVKLVSASVNKSFEKLIKNVQQKKRQHIDSSSEEKEIEQMIWDIYGLTDEERNICQSLAL